MLYWAVLPIAAPSDKRELREDFDSNMDKGQFSNLLKAAMLSWLSEDHRAKGERRG